VSRSVAQCREVSRSATECHGVRVLRSRSLEIWRLAFQLVLRMQRDGGLKVLNRGAKGIDGGMVRVLRCIIHLHSYWKGEFQLGKVYST